MIRNILPLLALGATALGVELVNDPFTDGSRTNASGGDPKGLVYYMGQNPSTGASLTVTDDSAGIGTGNALLLTPTANNQKYLATFPPATLANADEYIRVTFDFRFASTVPGVSHGFRVGLYNSNGTQQSSDSGTATPRTDDAGYVISFNPNTPWATNTNNTAFGVRKEASGDDLLGGGIFFTDLTASTFTSFPPCGTEKHRITLTITRLEHGDLEFLARLDDYPLATGTLAAAEVSTYTLDEFAFSFGMTFAPILLDNLIIVHGSSGTIELSGLTKDGTYSAPANLTLSATATDPDGIARVEYYDGTIKIAEALTPPYTAIWNTSVPGVHSITALLVDADGVRTRSGPIDLRVTGGTPDEYDRLRQRWRLELTGGGTYDPDNPIVANRLNAIRSQAQTHWDNMLKTGGDDRPYLWSDSADAADSRHTSQTASRLRSMALAYATPGSTLEENPALLADIKGGLAWLHANRYHENIPVSPASVVTNNFYDFEIGTPQHLNDIAVLLYEELSPSQLMMQMRAIEHFAPSPEYVRFFQWRNTAANLADVARVVALRGALVKAGSKLFSARDSLSSIFEYVTSGDGYYRDGSFIQHMAHPYNCHYGAELIASLSMTLQLIMDSTWEVVDPNLPNLYEIIHNGYEPFIFRAAAMDLVRGRRIAVSSTSDHGRGHNIISTILRIADFAPPSEAANFRAMARTWIQADTYRDFLTNNTLTDVLRAASVLADEALPQHPELVGHRQFPGMDRVVHRRPDFAFALSMSSSRIYNYEVVNSENLHGWHLGDGATYLYNSELDHYSKAYWPTVNPYRLAGTTVDTRTRANAEAQSTLSPMSWAGGAEILGLYGSAGMKLKATGSTLTARKSWFMF